MSSSSTAGRPFPGRLRSSTRPGTRHVSEDYSDRLVTAKLKPHDSSSSTRLSTSRLSTSRSRPENRQRVCASSVNTGNSFAATPQGLPHPGMKNSHAAGAAPASPVEGTKIHCTLKSDYHSGGARAPFSPPEAASTITDPTACAPEDKRTARRRRRAEAAAAAAAAASEAAENCVGFEESTLRTSRAAGKTHIHSNVSSAPDHSSVEWKAGVQLEESNQRKRSSTCLSSPAECLFSKACTQQCGSPAEPSSSSTDLRSAYGAAARASERKGNKKASDVAFTVYELTRTFSDESRGSTTRTGAESCVPTANGHSPSPASVADVQCLVTGKLPAAPDLLATEPVTARGVSNKRVVCADNRACPSSAAASGSSTVGGPNFASAAKLSKAENGPLPSACKTSKPVELDLSLVGSPRSSDNDTAGAMTCDKSAKAHSCCANSISFFSYTRAAKHGVTSLPIAGSGTEVKADATERDAVSFEDADACSREDEHTAKQAAGSVLKRGHEQCLQIASSPVEAEQRAGATSTVPGLLQSIPITHFEESLQVTAGENAFSTFSKPAALSDEGLVKVPDKDPTTPSEPSEFHLTSDLHGLDCFRGELLLNNEEFETLQSLLRPIVYRLAPSTSINNGLHSCDNTSSSQCNCGGIHVQALPGCSSGPLRKGGKASSRRLAQELHALQQAACAFAALPSRGSKRRREPKVKPLAHEEAEVISAKYSSSPSSAGGFRSTGTCRRDQEDAGENSESHVAGKGRETLSIQNSDAHCQQRRSRHWALRLDEDVEDEEGIADGRRGYQRGQQEGMFAGEAVDRGVCGDSDADQSSATSGLSRGRACGTSLKLWKRSKSIGEFSEGSLLDCQQKHYGGRRSGRVSGVRERRGGKGVYVDEVHTYRGGKSRSGARSRRRDHKALPRNDHSEKKGYEGHRGLQPLISDEGIREIQGRIHGNRKLWDDKQKKRTSAAISLTSGSEACGMGCKLAAESFGSAPSPLTSLLCHVTPRTDWREGCFLILQHLRRQPAARWFISQSCDVAGSADLPVQRLSLQDIEHKLSSSIFASSSEGASVMSGKAFGIACAGSRGREYVHPSQWQQEVRQIFFNAFTCEPAYHEVRRDAALLAAEFERCCRLVDQVNPYYPAMLRSRRHNGRLGAVGVAGRSIEHMCSSGMTETPTCTLICSSPQLPVSYVAYEGTRSDSSIKAREAPLTFGGSKFLPGPAAAPRPHEGIPVVYTQPVQPSQSSLSNICPQPSFIAGGTACTSAAAVFAGGALYDAPARMGYTSGAPLMHAGPGEQHQYSRSGCGGREIGVRGKRQQQQQHEAAATKGRSDEEDADCNRRLGESVACGYGDRCKESRGTVHESVGVSSRFTASASAGSPRRGRRGGRGRGSVRGGRRPPVADDLQISTQPQQQHIPGGHSWNGLGGHASGGGGMMARQQFLAPLGDIHLQPLHATGRALTVRAGRRAGGDGQLMLVRGAGLSGSAGFATGGDGPGTDAAANMLLLGSSAMLETVKNMEAPVGAPVLAPPPVPRIGVNDKPLSSSQRRTLEQNMQRLSSLQRKAALELIQDDLGILAAEYMNVKAFAFDTELLSIEKQKRLFAYVNSMFRANREILLCQQQQQVAAQVSAMSAAAADGAGEALQQQSHGARRGRRKRGDGDMTAEMQCVHSRSGSSSSSSGTDSDSDSSVSSSDSSSSSSSDSEEGSEERGNDSTQRSSASASDVSAAAVPPSLVSRVDTGNDTSRVACSSERGEAIAAAAVHGVSGVVRRTERFSGTAASGAWGSHGRGPGEDLPSRSGWPESGALRRVCVEVRPSYCVTDVTAGSTLQAKKGRTGPFEDVRLTGGGESVFVANTARPALNYIENESLVEAAPTAYSNIIELSPPESGVNHVEVTGQNFGKAFSPPRGRSSCGASTAEISSYGPIPIPAPAHLASTKGSTLHPTASSGREEMVDKEVQNATEEKNLMTEGFLGTYGVALPSKANGGSGRTLPQYTPVCEEGARMEIRAEVMGRHADFLGVLTVGETGIGSENEGARVGDCGGKSTAWREWKGQVIQQGFVAQRAHASQQQRSVSEIIAEGYNARI